MPVDPNRIDAIAGAVAVVYREAETALVRAMTKRLARGLDDSTWAIDRLNDLAGLRREALAVVTLLEVRGTPRVRQAVADAWREGTGAGIADIAAAYAPISTERARQARTAGRTNDAAIQALADAVVGEIRPVTAMILPSVESAYRRAIAGAASRQLAGVQSTRVAAQQAWSELVSQGVTGFTDRSGRRWRLSTYVEMATRSAVQRATVQGLLDSMTANGLDFGYVPDRPGECEKCRPYEGRILALNPGHPVGLVQVPSARRDETMPGLLTRIAVVATVEQARAAGLWHPNCQHSLAPFLPGVSKPRSTGAADPEGYAARQRQRALERHLRHWREQEAAALTPEAAEGPRARVAAWNDAMETHLQQHPKLVRRRYREQIDMGYLAAHERA